MQQQEEMKIQWLKLACGFKAEPRTIPPVTECGDNANIFGLRGVWYCSVLVNDKNI